MRHRFIAPITTVLIACLVVGILWSVAHLRAGQRGAPGAENQTVVPAGQSVTRLSDGRWLLAGGLGPRGPLATVVLRDAAGRVEKSASEIRLADARAWHSATMLADGRVLLLGGVGADGHIVASAELYDPASGAVQPVPWTDAPRAITLRR